MPTITLPQVTLNGSTGNFKQMCTVANGRIDCYIYISGNDSIQVVAGDFADAAAALTAWNASSGTYFITPGGGGDKFLRLENVDLCKMWVRSSAASTPYISMLRAD